MLCKHVLDIGERMSMLHFLCPVLQAMAASASTWPWLTLASLYTVQRWYGNGLKSSLETLALMIRQ